LSHESRFNLLEGALPPRRAYIGDAGLDICLQEDITVYPGQTVRSPAKITLDLAPYVAAHVMTRSSTSDKRVTIIPTVIDQSYNGKEISIFVSNFNTYPVSLKRGDYLAQIVLMPYYTFVNETGTQMNRTRNEGERFGSSDRQPVEETQEKVELTTLAKEQVTTSRQTLESYEHLTDALSPELSDEDDIDSMFKEDRPSEQKVFDQFTNKLGLTLTEAQDEYISSLPREQAKEMDDLCVSKLFVDKLADAVASGTNVVTVTPEDVIYDFVQESFSAFENSPVFTKVEDTDFGVVFHINDTLGDD
jgi:dUTP pyrophosphatase